MTVIAVTVEDEVITMAADSMHAYDHLIVTPKEIGSAKIFQQNGLIVGVAGEVGEANQMRLFAKNHTPKEPSAESVCEFIAEFKEWLMRKDSDAEFSCAYLIAFKGKCFRTYSRNYDVFEIPQFHAIGTGEPYAVTALHLGHGAKKAVEIACELNPWCRPPVTVFTTSPKD